LIYKLLRYYYLAYRVIFEDKGLRDYKEMWDYQATLFSRLTEEKRNIRLQGKPSTTASPGVLIFVEHPHVYTLGRHGSENNLLVSHIQLQAKNASFYRIDRGGDITYHGPGQIVGYPVFDLEAVGVSLKGYIHGLEEAVIRTLSIYGLKGERMDGATGVWLDSRSPGKARKICAIGVKASRYITMHGFAFNVNTALEYFGYINPCGFTDRGVTSLQKELGEHQDIEKVKGYLKDKLREVFDLEYINQGG